MVFKLKCKKCGSIIRFDSDKKSYYYPKCSGCNQVLNMSVEAKLNNVANMDGFELVEVESSFSKRVFKEDLQSIEKIYEESSADKQKHIESIIDRVYLLINRDDIHTCEKLAEMLRNFV